MTSYLSIDLIELDEVEHAHGARTRKKNICCPTLFTFWGRIFM